MRLSFVILILFNFLLVSENMASANNSSVTDGGSWHIKKKRYAKKHLVKVNRKQVKTKQILSPKLNANFKQRTKGKAILMAVLTGPLGGHRLYLGTKPYIPIIYALTLGGGLGFLPVVDIVVIALSKDLSKYYNNPQIMMW